VANVEADFYRNAAADSTISVARLAEGVVRTPEGAGKAKRERHKKVENSGTCTRAGTRRPHDPRARYAPETHADEGAIMHDLVIRAER